MAEKPFGPYTLVRQVAVGGMAEIYLAKVLGIAGFEKFVALKMIHPNFSQDQHFVQMLIDEAKITVQLQHVNIAQTFDLGRVGETYYLTMEYVEGADLFRLMRRTSEVDIPVPFNIAAYITREIANGLDYAHRKRDSRGRSLGIVHRDVSPQNVLISFNGDVKLVDFGVAKASMRARQTQVGVIKGKYYYMSPEQAIGATVDRRSDIFSLGILLYEMIVGQMLYLEDNLQVLLDMVRRADIAPPRTLRPDVPEELENICMRALAKNPAHRFQSAAEFSAALENVLHGHTPATTPTSVANWISSVLRAPLPSGYQRNVPPTDPPPMEALPEEPTRQQMEETRRISADLVAHDRSDFVDEHSVILAIPDLALIDSLPDDDLAEPPPPPPKAASLPRLTTRKPGQSTPFRPITDAPPPTVRSPQPSINPSPRPVTSSSVLSSSKVRVLNPQPKSPTIPVATTRPPTKPLVTPPPTMVPRAGTVPRVASSASSRESHDSTLPPPLTGPGSFLQKRSDEVSKRASSESGVGRAGSPEALTQLDPHKIAANRSLSPSVVTSAVRPPSASADEEHPQFAEIGGDQTVVTDPPPFARNPAESTRMRSKSGAEIARASTPPPKVIIASVRPHRDDTDPSSEHAHNADVEDESEAPTRIQGFAENVQKMARVTPHPIAAEEPVAAETWSNQQANTTTFGFDRAHSEPTSGEPTTNVHQPLPHVAQQSQPNYTPWPGPSNNGPVGGWPNAAPFGNAQYPNSGPFSGSAPWPQNQAWPPSGGTQAPLIAASPDNSRAQTALPWNSPLASLDAMNQAPMQDYKIGRGLLSFEKIVLAAIVLVVIVVTILVIRG